MRQRDYAAAAGLALAITVAGVWVAAAMPGHGAGSTLSRGPDGWLAARRYLEARGCRISLLDQPPREVPGVLAVVFPWQGVDLDTGQEPLERHLQRGGTLLFAYSGRGSWVEPAVAAALGMGHDETRERPPLHPLRWREYAAASSSLVPQAAVAGLTPLRVSRARDWVVPPADATILFRDESGRPAAFSYGRWSGRVFVVPASVFSNARIEEAGNAGLLESLVRALGSEWAFDEYHHGLVSSTHATAGTATTRAMDLFLLQLAFVYALALLAVGRRFGPPWHEPPVVAGSTASFLRGVGALHHRLGHHWSAGALLVERARQMHPRIVIPEATPSERSEAGLLRLAQDVGRAQTGEEKR